MNHIHSGAYRPVRLEQYILSGDNSRSIDALKNDYGIIRESGLKITKKGAKVLKPHLKPALKNYPEKRVLGKGRSGSVYEASKNQVDYAIKTGLHNGDQSRLLGFLNEAAIHFLVAEQLRGSTVDIHKVLITPNEIHFVLEKGSESLKSSFTEGSFSPLLLPDVILQLTEVLQALHALGIAHRDLKKDNILFEKSEDGHIQLKLIDFGSSRQDSQAVEGEKYAEAFFLKDLLNDFNNLPQSKKDQLTLDESSVLAKLKSLSTPDNEMEYQIWLDSLKNIAMALKQHQISALSANFHLRG